MSLNSAIMLIVMFRSIGHLTDTILTLIQMTTLRAKETLGLIGELLSRSLTDYRLRRVLDLVISAGHVKRRKFTCI